MIKQALEYIVGLNETKVQEVNGRKYSDKSLIKIKEPLPASLQISTLTGLVDYIKNNPDKIDKEIIVQVHSESKVSLLSALNFDKEREFYIECNARTPKITLDNFIDVERFNIMLQSCFLDIGDRATILKVIGNIKEENVKTTGDDGISQSVIARVGIAQVEPIKVPNPVTLVPFRTFIEVEQPESKYVFRMKDGPSCTLFEADGGEWRLKAMLRIKKYLEEQLEGYDNVKILA